ncbi:hypothetical protein [Luedemannella helvata]|uniref:hypothetical protein n=1 Tax=Luedemannella helvata TaxID=349315 RepID=UPI0031DE835B
MSLKVIEGRLFEAQVGAGVERRAFGEFVGPCGELASYAFGWTTECEHHVARLTVGIGAGNPGGASFHAVVFDNEDSYACSLVDEPFERVPEGGPDLTAAEARAHPDLPFIWWVVDRVMERDRRARWMKHWLLGTTSIQTGEVFDRKEPILYVSHDADDGVWQLIGAGNAVPASGKLSHLHHAVEHDLTLLDVLDLEPGECAYRTGPDAPWTSEPS